MTSQEGAGLSEQKLRYIADNVDAMGTNLLRQTAQDLLATITDRDAAIKRQFHDIMELRSRLSAAEADNARLRQAIMHTLVRWPGSMALDALRQALNATKARSDAGEK